MPISAQKMDSILVNKLGFSKRPETSCLRFANRRERGSSNLDLSWSQRDQRPYAGYYTMARQMGITSSQLKAIVKGEISLLREQGWLE